MEILCAYVRKNCGPPPEMSAEVRAAYGAMSRNDEQDRQIAERETVLRPPFVDVQAAMTVIGRRGADRRLLEMNLRDISANPDAYRLDFTGAALMLARLEGLHFEEALLNSACLEGARLNRAYLEGASLPEAHLEGASLVEAHLEDASLVEAHLEDAWLDGAHLERAWLSGAHLEGARLNRAHLERAWLNEAHLEGAVLNEAHLKNAWLYSAHLEGASLEEARLTEANLDSASLDDALLDGADLSAAENLSIVALAAAWGDDRTTLPSGIDRPINKRWAAGPTDANLSLGKLFGARNYAWHARRDYWLGEARRRREAEEAARRNPRPEGEGRPGGPG
jgi:uncharacterized protein YjbI with pentapeptide repeats